MGGVRATRHLTSSLKTEYPFVKYISSDDAREREPPLTGAP